jgi:hypothetical protein
MSQNTLKIKKNKLTNEDMQILEKVLYFSTSFNYGCLKEALEIAHI